MLVLPIDTSMHGIPMTDAQVKIFGCKGVYPALPWEEYEMVKKTRTVKVPAEHTKAELDASAKE